jgi:hypothetical protein
MVSTAEVDVAAIRARADAATPGPWHYDTFNYIFDSGRGAEAKIVATILDHPHDETYQSAENKQRQAWYTESYANAHFIEASRTDIPLLCDALEAAHRRIERLESGRPETAAEFFERVVPKRDAEGA